MVIHKAHIANFRRGFDMIYGNWIHLNARAIFSSTRRRWCYFFISFFFIRLLAILVFISLSSVLQKAIWSVVMHVHFNIESKVHIQWPNNFIFIPGTAHFVYVIKCFTFSWMVCLYYIIKIARAPYNIYEHIMHLNAPKIVIKKAEPKKNFVVKQRNSKLCCRRMSEKRLFFGTKRE